MSPHHRLGHAELLADAAHLVLEQQPQRLDEVHAHVCGQSAHVVMRLDHRRDAVLAAARLDHIGIERPLDEEANVSELPRFLFEYANELLAYDLALFLRIVDALEA